MTRAAGVSKEGEPPQARIAKGRGVGVERIVFRVAGWKKKEAIQPELQRSAIERVRVVSQ